MQRKGFRDETRLDVTNNEDLFQTCSDKIDCIHINITRAWMSKWSVGQAKKLSEALGRSWLRIVAGGISTKPTCMK